MNLYYCYSMEFYWNILALQFAACKDNDNDNAVVLYFHPLPCKFVLALQLL